MPGMGELLIILAIVLLIFGAGKLPAIGDAIGRSIKNFRRAAGGNDELEVSKSDDETSKGDRELPEGRHGELESGAVSDAEVLAERKRPVKDEA